MMTNQLAGRFGGAPFKYYGDWTDRIAKGELPQAKPTRPQGVERNIVVTSWEWGDPKKYLHDLIASDRRNPTVNAYGPLFGSPEYSTDNYADPRSQDAQGDVLQDAGARSRHAGSARARTRRQPSSRCSPRPIGATRRSGTPGPTTTTRMFDKKGRVWLAANVRGMDNPDFCKKGSDHPSAKVFPLERSSRQVTMLDPKTMKYTFVDTCFGTHHPQFGYDANDTLWLSGTGQVAGWINTKMFDETGDAAKAQGWSPFVLDTNGNGKRDDYVEPDQPVDPAKDKRIAPALGPYAVMPSPVDGSIWYTVGVFAGTPGFLRFDPATQTDGSLQRAAAGLRHPRRRHRQERRAVGVGCRAAISPASTAASARVRSTGRRRPAIIVRRAGRSTSIPARASQGSGRTAPSRATTPGSTSTTRSGSARTSRCRPPTSMTGLVALKDGKMILLRVPYPMGFYAKGFDGRIDDPNAGWKGRGLWTTSGDRTPWLMEGGKGSMPRAVHFQLRPDPLAR